MSPAVALERVVVIVNPISGTGGRPERARRRIASAEAALKSHHTDGRVLVTERSGHASLLARDALADGASLVIAWGGDGTINEVASELAFRDVSLAVIPSGSGNGLARELKIPCDVERAFAVAFGGTERVIDAGEIEGRLFFNVAGIGLDAEVAHEFASTGLVRRGFSRYIEIATRRLFSFTANEYRIVADGVNKLKNKNNAMLVITHYQRLLNYIIPDFVHVLYDGKIIRSEGKELALAVEEKGYDWLIK